MKNSNQIQKYQNEIKKKIPDEYPGKKEILQAIEHNLYDFLEEHPTASFENILEEFGSPSEIANSFMERLSGKEIHTIFQKRKRQKKVLLSICILFLILFLLLCRYLYYLFDNTAVIIEETIIIEDTQNL